MKKCSIGFLILVFGIFYGMVVLKTHHWHLKLYDRKRTSEIFDDSTGVEFYHILHLLNIENDSIATFQENFGYPAIKGSFQKKDEDSKITTIPMVKIKNYRYF
ncbi:MAG: hypothetical protein IPI53_11735 [Saprospiraceae bacterium]|nr:hypothetical protein [Saprospiraceae bacterium]